MHIDVSLIFDFCPSFDSPQPITLFFPPGFPLLLLPWAIKFQQFPSPPGAFLFLFLLPLSPTLPPSSLIFLSSLSSVEFGVLISPLVFFFCLKMSWTHVFVLSFLTTLLILTCEYLVWVGGEKGGGRFFYFWIIHPQGTWEESFWGYNALICAVMLWYGNYNSMNVFVFCFLEHDLGPFWESELSEFMCKFHIFFLNVIFITAHNLLILFEGNTDHHESVYETFVKVAKVNLYNWCWLLNLIKVTHIYMYILNRVFSGEFRK